MRCLSSIPIFFLTLTLSAATLEKLSVDDMIVKSTSIVRGRIGASYTESHNSLVYTHYRVTVSSQLKGKIASQVDVAVPGGVYQGYRQVFAGAPVLTAGEEYFLFLWTGKSGMTQIIGLSQGLFTLTAPQVGDVLLKRPATEEMMLDPKSGQPVRDQAISLNLRDVTARIRTTSGQQAQ